MSFVRRARVFPPRHAHKFSKKGSHGIDGFFLHSFSTKIFSALFAVAGSSNSTASTSLNNGHRTPYIVSRLCIYVL